MEETTRLLLASLEEQIGNLKKERDHYRSCLSVMQLSRESQTRTDAITALHEGDKIRRGSG